MAIREGLWDCPSCGRKGNRGPERHCPGCSAPRGEEVVLYPAPDAPEVRDPAALATARAGADWTCQFCGGDNRATDEICRGCSAPRGEAEERATRVVRHDYGPPQAPKPVASAGPAPPALPAKTKRSRGRMAWGCLALVVVGALLGLWLTRPKPATLVVSGLSWERSVEVEARVVEQGEAWSDELPDGAMVLSRTQVADGEERVEVGTEKRTVQERVQVGTEKVKVGERDLGNGYFEDVYEDRPVYEMQERVVDEPVYRQRPKMRERARYTLQSWKTVRSERAGGARDRRPSWPPLRLGPDERAGQRNETFSVHFTAADGEAWTYEAESEAEWSGFRVGGAYRVDLGRGGKVRSVEGPA